MAARALCLLLALAAAGSGALACTTVMVGAGATTDGSIIMARNNDEENATVIHNLYYHPARTAAAPFRSNTNEFGIALPAGGLAYTAAPKNYGLWPPEQGGRNATFQEIGVNSAGVAVSDTETIFNSEAALAVDPYVEDTGLTEDVLTAMLIPQIKSAREGALRLGALIEGLGAGEGFGVLFADANESWYLETGSGHHWLAQRIPDDAIFVSANQGRFQGADLSDPATALASHGIAEFAVQHGLLTPGEPFNFLRAFVSDLPADALYNYPRVCAVHEMLAGIDNATCWGEAPYFKVFPAPPAKLSVHSVMAALRNHYDFTPWDPYTNQDPSAPHRPVAVLRTSLSHVTRIMPPSLGLPDGLSVINYFAQSMPRLAPYIPLYKGLPGDRIPPQLTNAGWNEPDPTSLFWKARRLQALVFQNWPLLASNATAAILAFEQDVDERQRTAFEADYKALVGRGDQRGADGKMAEFTQSVVDQAVKLLEELAAAAAAALGMNGVPPDNELYEMVNDAYDTYSYHRGG